MFLPDSFDFADQKDQGINVIQVWLHQVTGDWYLNTPLPFLFSGIVLTYVYSIFPKVPGGIELQLPTAVSDLHMHPFCLSSLLSLISLVFSGILSKTFCNQILVCLDNCSGVNSVLCTFNKHPRTINVNGIILWHCLEHLLLNFYDY